MIGSLKGIVIGMVRDSIVVEVHGVGYRTYVPISLLAKTREGDELFVWTHHAVRENADDLYGFETKEELVWFELLLTVSGVGPKSALSIMNAVDTESLQRSIIAKDAAGLSKAFGIGKKTAEKIVLELKEKVGGTESGAARPTGSDGDVIDALVGLGYSTREARDAVQLIPKEAEGTEARIREAIRIASGTR